MEKTIKVNFVLLVYFVLGFSHSLANPPNLKNCMLLPVEDTFQDTISFKVFLEIENYLKESDWCYYKYNSEILNILGGYKNNLSSHLRNKIILKLVADKTKAGSLIKIRLIKKSKGIRLKLIIYGANGGDKYFDETIDLETIDLNLVSRTIKNWLNIFSKDIPYDGQIVGILGDQFTIDMGQEMGLIPGTLVKILRPIRKRKHPLLKKIVDWETKEIGSAKIFLSSDSSSQGKVYDYEPKEKLKIGDWVLIDNRDIDGVVKIPGRINFPKEDNSFKYGRLGEIGLLLNFGTGAAISNKTASDSVKLGGILLGLDANLEVWLTRNFWTELSFLKNFGTLELEEGSISSISSATSYSQFKLKFGFKYLPLGFFYGPQIDGYIGFANYGYSLDHLPTAKLTGISVSGFVMGVRASMPIINKLRGFIGFDFLLGPGFEEEKALNGSVESASHYHLNFGGDYIFARNIKLTGSFSIDVSKGTYSESKDVKLKNSALKTGIKFTF
jgi:hypothetical protein